MKKQILIILGILLLIASSFAAFADTTFFENPDDTTIYETAQQITAGTGGGVGGAINQTAIGETVSEFIKDYSTFLIIFIALFIIFLIFLYKRRKKKK